MADFINSTFMDGYVGGPHITERQIREANQASFGSDDYVLEGGREAEAQILTNNSIRIFDAVYCIQGGRDVIAANDYSDVTISNGTQGVNRNDIIVRRYQKDESSEEESMEYAVIKGVPTSGDAVDPEVTVGDMRNGATLHEMKLYRVKIQGLNIVALEPLFKVLYNKDSIQKKLEEAESKITELNGKYKDYTLLGSGNDSAQTVNIDISEYDYLYCYINYPPIQNINPTLIYKDLLVDGDNQVIRVYWSSGVGVVHGTIQIAGNTLQKIRTNGPTCTMYVYGVK